MAVEVYEDEIFPTSTQMGTRPLSARSKLQTPSNSTMPFERAVDAVGPSVVGAAELFGAALEFGDYGGGMVAADVVEGAELGIVAADDDDGFAGDIGGEELAFLADLVGPSDYMPGSAEDTHAFEFFDAFVPIPGGWDRGGFFERVAGVVEIEDVLD